MAGTLNVTGTSLWNWDYLIACFAEEKICVSFGLWILSCLFWVTSSALHLYLRCKKKSRHKESVIWDIYGFFGSMCNTIGALLSKQLTIQVITGGYMALAEVIHFVVTLFPVSNSKYRTRSGRRSSRAYRNHKAIMAALWVPFFVGAGCYCLYPPGHPSSEVLYAPKRRLLASVLQERVDVVGFTLGMIAVIVSWTVRVPLITKVCKGMVFPVVQVWAVLLSALASVMYAAAIMSHDRRPEYFIRAAPWFLISVGAAALDVALIFLSCMMQNKLVRQMGFVVEAMGVSDSCELLAQGEEEMDETRTLTKEEENLNWTPLTTAPGNICVRSKTSLGRYVRLSIEQVQEWDFEELNQQWDESADVSSIRPNDSSVLNVRAEQEFPPTF